MGYLCANFSLPRPVLELGPMYVTDRQTRRQTKASLNAAAYWGEGGITSKLMKLILRQFLARPTDLPVSLPVLPVACADQKNEESFAQANDSSFFWSALSPFSLLLFFFN